MANERDTRRRSPYHQTIQNELSRMKRNADPRHIEGFMRLEYGTLDHLPRSTFRMEIVLFFEALSESSIRDWEDNARSFGL